MAVVETDQNVFGPARQAFHPGSRQALGKALRKGKAQAPAAQAHRMLTAAFCREVLEVADGPLREAAEAALDLRLESLA